MAKMIVVFEDGLVNNRPGVKMSHRYVKDGDESLEDSGAIRMGKKLLQSFAQAQRIPATRVDLQGDPVDESGNKIETQPQD